MTGIVLIMPPVCKSHRMHCHKFDTICMSLISILFILVHLRMVEAVGVEPTSETTFNREHSCFSAFIFVSSSTLRTGEDAATTSLIDLV
jgi:hypothetical protein